MDHQGGVTGRLRRIFYARVHRPRKRASRQVLGQETEEMVLRGAQESLDIDTTFTVGLSEAAKLLD